jgi:hypothetical protein
MRTHTLLVLSVFLLAVSIPVTALAFSPRNTSPGCTHVQGRLFNAVAGADPGKMIGTITGDYFIDTEFPFPSYDPDDTAVLFMWVASHVEGPRGTIFFREYAALDLDEQVGTNGAVLLLVTGGTGQWEDASGHITLSGFFHTDESTGEWDYQGEVCRP